MERAAFNRQPYGDERGCFQIPQVNWVMAEPRCNGPSVRAERQVENFRRADQSSAIARLA